MKRGSQQQQGTKPDEGAVAASNATPTQVQEVALPSPGAANALNNTRKFYRDPPYGNLMFDPRVCRGSPFVRVRPAPSGPAGDVGRRAAPPPPPESDSRPLTPQPVDGRVHATVQTERYLELLFEGPLTVDVECQTDLFMDRPSSPYYVNEKVGEDEDTQIYPGDLWDFDIESHPVVEVLVSRTLEMALIEALEEDEAQNLRAQQRRFEERREGERAEQRRLEEQERRLQEEKERRIKQFKEAMATQREAAERVAAAMLTQGYLADLLPNVLEGLTLAGYLLEDMRADVQEHVIPWLSEQVSEQMEEKVKVDDIMTSIVRGIVEARALTYRLLGEADDAVGRQPVMPQDEPTGEVSEGGPEYIKEMGPEEAERPPPEEIPMKGAVMVRKRFTYDPVPKPVPMPPLEESPEESPPDEPIPEEPEEEPKVVEAPKKVKSVSEVDE